MHLISRASFILLFFCFTVISNAQQRSVLIKVVDAKNNPVAFANIALTNKLDSTKSINAITDTFGLSKINVVAQNSYTLKVSAIGYKKFSKEYLINEQTSFAVKLAEDPTQLNEVVVKSSKPLIRQEDDKSVVDPEPLAASSTNAYVHSFPTRRSSDLGRASCRERV